MAVEVVVLARGSSDVLMRWEVRGGAFADDSRWRELERRLARELREGRGGTAEIYFRYLGPPFENHDRQLITGLLAASNRYAPGSRTHAVFGPHTVDGLDATFDLEVVCGWYRTALSSGLDDILELPLDRGAAPTEIGLLRSANARSEARDLAVRDLAAKQDRWLAVFSERAPDALAAPAVSILDPYVRYDAPDGSREPIVVVIRETEPEGQRELVERVVDEHRPDRFVVAMLRAHPAPELKALWRRLGLGSLVFRGPLELRYFLLRLNASSVVEGPRVSADMMAKFASALGCKRPPFSIDPPTVTRVQKLRFDELTPEEFEFLCLAWVSSQPDFFDPHIYGINGEAQEGIDFVATRRRDGREEIWAYQCKRHEKYDLSQLRKAIDKIRFTADVKVILLSSRATIPLRKEATRLGVRLMDGQEISGELKRHPELVEDFFGPGWRQAFSGPSR